MSLHATNVKNRSGYIVEAIRENYIDLAVQKEREVRAQKAKQKDLEDLMAEFKVKRDNILRQVVHTQPMNLLRAPQKKSRLSWSANGCLSTLPP